MTFHSLVIYITVLAVVPVQAWAPPATSTNPRLLETTLFSDSNNNNNNKNNINRRTLLETSISAVFVSSWLLPTSAANALVKGNAPPPKKKATSDKPKCTNVDECEAARETLERELAAEQELGPPPKITSGGTRYRDLENGNPDKGIVKEGDEVTIYYKILKIGKRSYDGISGEGTVVFSRGYGLEDDEKAPGSKSFVTTVGAFQNVAALNDALKGMAVGGLRRFAVLPQKGWEKPTKMCDGGPGGKGAGGDLRTDYVVVPTATMVSTEACFDTTKLPFPTTYAEQRRMAQRFDQSLIMEVQVVDINTNPTLQGL